MKKALFFSALFIATTASAQAPSGSASSDGSYNPNQMICRTSGETGSRLERTRVCKTRAEWDAQRRDTRQSIDRAQTTRVIQGE